MVTPTLRIGARGVAFEGWQDSQQDRNDGECDPERQRARRDLASAVTHCLERPEERGPEHEREEEADARVRGVVAELVIGRAPRLEVPDLEQECACHAELDGDDRLEELDRDLLIHGRPKGAIGRASSSPGAISWSGCRDSNPGPSVPQTLFVRVSATLRVTGNVVA